MLYLNIGGKIPARSRILYLTLTSVVFECRGREIGGAFGYNLTLTSVVFEFIKENLFMCILVDLTLTSVVFE